MNIIKAILAGERDPNVLSLNRQEGCRNSKETIAKSLVGNFRDDHMLRSSKRSNYTRPTRPRLPSVNKPYKASGTQPNVTDDQPPESGKHVRARNVCVPTSMSA